MTNLRSLFSLAIMAAVLIFTVSAATAGNSPLI